MGPLHHSLKSFGKLRGYLNMEQHKEIYLAAFRGRVGETTIAGFRRIIKEDEEKIRESYSESTAWIHSQAFVEMILHDSVFILELLLKTFYMSKGSRTVKTGDLLMDKPCLQNTVREDLIKFENQLPYFILEKLFDPIVTRLYPNNSFRELIITYSGFRDKIGNNSKFRHFTDLFQCVRVETLWLGEPESGLRKNEVIKHVYNADKLDSAGVKFQAVEDELSLDVKFENRRLKIPCFWVRDGVEITLRNIIALEKCHYPFSAYICNYFMFLDFLIDTDKDIDLLVEKGILKNWIGDHGSVAKMVNKLCVGIFDVGSYYSDIALDLNAHYEDKWNQSRSILKRVYFSNLWTGTATIAATFLLLLTLIQTVASILQVKHK